MNPSQTEDADYAAWKISDSRSRTDQGVRGMRGSEAAEGHANSKSHSSRGNGKQDRSSVHREAPS